MGRKWKILTSASCGRSSAIVDGKEMMKEMLACCIHATNAQHTLSAATASRERVVGVVPDGFVA